MNQFLVVVIAAALKQQTSKFYSQILSTEASFYMYDRLQIDINVVAWLRFDKFANNILMFAVLVTGKKV